MLLAAALGLLDPAVALLLFSATVLMGIFISTASLIIAEQKVKYFSGVTILKLLFFSFLENFGYRQLISMWRVVGYLSVIRGTSGWGSIQRTGFTGNKK